MESFRKTAVYLTAFGLIILLFSFIPLKAADYVYKDANGDEVILPTQLPVIRLDKPEIWARIAPFHTPEIKTKVRKEGLESVRRVTLRLAEPVREKSADSISKIYLIDKDGLIVGYHAFSPRQQTVTFRLNGVINYVTFYVECTRHGLWRKDVRFEKMKG